jgi:amino acid transporter
MILVLAANTSFNGLPVLTSVMAKDRFLPRQFSFRGDRLAFSYGIVALGAASAGLLVVFGGETHRLIPLYAVGVFTGFTLSQAGMVLHWRQTRERGWTRALVINGVAAVPRAVANHHRTKSSPAPIICRHYLATYLTLSAVTTTG